MQASVFALLTVLGLVGWHGQDHAASPTARPVLTAYRDAVQRYDGAQSLQRSSSPQRTQPSADGTPSRRPAAIG